MNKTLALLAAVGVLASATAPAFAADDATAVKKEEKKVEKTVKENEAAPAAGETAAPASDEEATH